MVGDMEEYTQNISIDKETTQAVMEEKMNKQENNSQKHENRVMMHSHPNIATATTVSDSPSPSLKNISNNISTDENMSSTSIYNPINNDSEINMEKYLCSSDTEKEANLSKTSSKNISTKASTKDSHTAIYSENENCDKIMENSYRIKYNRKDSDKKSNILLQDSQETITNENNTGTQTFFVNELISSKNEGNFEKYKKSFILSNALIYSNNSFKPNQGKEPKSQKQNPGTSFARSLNFLKDSQRIIEKADNILSYLRQIMFMLAVSSCMCVLGGSMSWPAMLPNIEEDSQFNITNHDVRWLVSSLYLTAIPGNLVGGSFGELVGPKTGLMIILPLTMACWTILTFAPSVTFIYLPRICLGFFYGLVNTLVQPLVTEMCESRIRGLASFLPEVIASSSLLIGYIQAHFLPWRISAAVSAGILVPVFILMFFVPESPYWLMRRGRPEQSSRSISRVLGPSRAQHKEEILQEIKSSIENQRQESLLDQVHLLRAPQNWKPLLLVCILVILRETTGKISVFMYTVYVFKMADVALNPFLCTILVGVARLISTFAGASVIDKAGRKVLLLATSMLCFASITTAGVVLLTDQSFPGGKIIPLVCVLIFCVAYSTGVGPVVWALMGELLPTPVRSISTSIVCVCFSSSMFLMTNFFPMMMDELGLAYCFVIFGLFNVLFSFIVWMFVPETKGKTLLELEMIFSTKMI